MNWTEKQPTCTKLYWTGLKLKRIVLKSIENKIYFVEFNWIKLNWSKNTELNWPGLIGLKWIELH